MKFLLCATLFTFICMTIVSSSSTVKAVDPITLTNGSVIPLNDPSKLTGWFTTYEQTGLAPGNYPWSMSLIDKTIVPSGSKMCGSGAFLAEGVEGVQTCAEVFDTASHAPHWDATTSSVVFAFTSTQQWVATVLCACSTGSLAAVGSYAASQQPSGPITLRFSVTSSQCCAQAPGSGDDGKSGGITWGGVFLILFFVPLGIYVIAMVAWNYKNEKRGKDLAPHPEFWGALPGFAKDGVTFLWSKIRGTPWSPSEASSSSGGQGAAGEVGGNYAPV